MSKVRAELQIGTPGGPESFVLVDCTVELLPEGGAYPWCATDDQGHRYRSSSRSAAVLALFAERLNAGDEAWGALGGVTR